MNPTDRRIDRLIHLMVKHATVVVPGPKIAGEIGVTRSTVWMWVEKLRGLGVEVEGVPGVGYKLQSLPDVLVPSLICPELGDNLIGNKIIHYFRIDSTNDLALTLALEGARHGTVVVSEEQVAGRGRFGRNWYSERSSGIYTSIILRPPLAPSAAPILTLMAGLAAHQAVTEVTALPVDIRWPNDLMVHGKKMCGILTEMSAEMDRIHAVVLGIGINVNHRQMPSALEAIGTSLHIESGKSYSRAKLFVALLKQLEHHYRMLIDGGSAAIVERWSNVSSYACGKRIRVTVPSGSFEATTLGLDPEGVLRVRRDDSQEERLLAGEITELR